MVKVILNGCNGKMGKNVSDIISKDEEVTIVAGIDSYDKQNDAYPVFSSFDRCDIKGDVVIDFSTAAAVDGLLDYCEKNNTPLVLCSTGLSEQQLEKVKKTSEKVAVLRSANMSLGINLIMKILGEYSERLASAGFDIEIIEKHHNQKIDAPSGTAIALADSINDALNNEYEYVYDRTLKREKRSEKEIGISSVRGGTIVGDHDVIFAGADEVITISHSAYSKALFGNGAVAAAKYLAGKGAGLYSMKEVVD